MNTLLGKWHRYGIEMNITRDKIVTSVLDPLVDERRTLTHDYLLEADWIRMYSPTIREIKHAFKGELRIVMLTPGTLQLESEGSITNWNRR